MKFLMGGYGLTWFVLVVYTLSLLIRTKKCNSELKNG